MEEYKKKAEDYFIRMYTFACGSSCGRRDLLFCYQKKYRRYGGDAAGYEWFWRKCRYGQRTDQHGDDGRRI